MTQEHETGFRCLAAWETARGAQAVAVGELDDGRIALLKGPIPAGASGPNGERLLTDADLAGLTLAAPAFTFDQAQGLAAAVLNDNPQAMTRPTALKELAAFCVALLASLTQPQPQEKETDDVEP